MFVDAALTAWLWALNVTVQESEIHLFIYLVYSFLKRSQERLGLEFAKIDILTFKIVSYKYRLYRNSVYVFLDVTCAVNGQLMCALY